MVPFFVYLLFNGATNVDLHGYLVDFLPKSKKIVDGRR